MNVNKLADGVFSRIVGNTREISSYDRFMNVEDTISSNEGVKKHLAPYKELISKNKSILYFGVGNAILKPLFLLESAHADMVGIIISFASKTPVLGKINAVFSHFNTNQHLLQTMIHTFKCFKINIVHAVSIWLRNRK
jgi:hypothetical protein